MHADVTYLATAGLTQQKYMMKIQKLNFVVQS